MQHTINGSNYHRVAKAALLATTMLALAGGAQAEVSEIVVTAQKRAESLQSVAVSMTAISDLNIEKFSIKNFQDYLTAVPGLTSTFGGPVSDVGVRQIGLRGVQTVNGTQASGQNTVGFYINNTPVPITNPRLVDIERIEVLRGPQGTLYGSSSLAGTIKIVTKKPDLEAISAFIGGGVSTTKKSGEINYEMEGMINLPVSDKVAMRVSGYHENNGGFIDYVDVTPAGAPTGFSDKDVNDEMAYGARADILLVANENLSFRTNFAYDRREVDAQDRFTPSAPGLTARFPILEPAHDESFMADFEIEWDVGSGTVVSTTSYYDQSSFILNDQSRNAPLVFLVGGGRPLEIGTPNNASHEEITHETRYVSNWDGPLQSIVGVFYTDREEVTQSHIFVPNAATLLGIYPIPNGTILRNFSLRDRREMAVFGNLTYNITDQLSFGVGLRYFDFSFKTKDDFTGSALFVRNQAFSSTGQASEDGVVPRFEIEYNPSNDHMIYASAGKGFRMGGANFPLPTIDAATGACDASLTAFFGKPEMPSSYESDSLWSYEVGSKNALFNNKVTLNISAFHIDWKDTQVQIQISGLGCSFGGLSTNVGSVRSRGLEVELAASPFENFNMAVGVSYIDAEVNEDLRFPGATVTIANKGDRMPNIPEWTFSVLGDYTFPLTSSWNGFLRGDVRYQGDRAANFAPGNPNRPIREAFTIANFRAGVQVDAWEVAAFVENAFDARPFLLGEPPLPTQTKGGQVFENTIRPRTIGLQVTGRF